MENNRNHANESENSNRSSKMHLMSDNDANKPKVTYKITNTELNKH